MSRRTTDRNFSRRKALAGIGATGAILAGYAGRALAGEASAEPPRIPADAKLVHALTAAAMKTLPAADGDFVETAGFYAPGDGGGALYCVQKPGDDTKPNEADAIALESGLVAVLIENQAVNYKVFGAVGDGDHDDGVQIKIAHQYAGRHKIPVVNLSGEFWIVKTNSIPITTNVHWGQTTFHIDERYNDKRNARFIVENDSEAETIELDDDAKAVLLERIRPGVQLIPELAPYAGHLISVVDTNDRIGIRAGSSYSKRGWAREELFYVEEEGRIIGDIAWQFKDFTTVTAIPCNDNYLVIEGGGFYFSGDTPADNSPGYHQHGISIRRSRTIVREQWMGLEPGKSDTSLEPRSGFYTLSRVYDVTLENIRAMPWEKNRRDKEKAVKHGTYGIGGARMLDCTFRNLTAEAGWVSWGVFGTNLNKNFRVENCRLNRVDVHFHCWNLYITDSTIGFKGISVTGGGDLFIENTVRHGRDFVHFRPDYGAKWDGDIRIRNCTFKPSRRAGTASVLTFRPSNFDYKYPVGFARSITIEDLLVDYGAAPESDSPCWMMNTASFSETENCGRLFFPRRVTFRNVAVEGREQGVRLLRIPDPYRYDLRTPGTYDGSRLEPNCRLTCDNVQLERLTPGSPDDTDRVHLLIGQDTAGEYTDSAALYPKIRFTDCDNVCVYLGNCIASAFFERCTLNVVNAPGLAGELVFSDCRFQPNVSQASADLYSVASTLGTRFTNCTLHAPVVAGNTMPEMVNRFGFLEINKSLRHYHLNTAIANDVLEYAKSNGVTLSPEFIAKLTVHHGAGG